MEPYLTINFGADHPGKSWGLKEIVATIGSHLKDRQTFQGCRLPPVRVLAHQLGVSKNTVHSAYEELKSSGLIESRDRKGLFVQFSEENIKPFETKTIPPPALKDFPAIQNFRKPKGVSDTTLNLSAVFIDPRLLPKEKLAECFRSALKMPGLPGFPDLQGFLPLREKISQRLKRRGIQAGAENIIITNGSQQALDLVARSLSTKTIATENPAYYVGKALFQLNGLEVIGLPIRPFGGIDRQEWESLLQKHKPGLVYLTSSYQNPTGYSYSSDELSQIIEWSRKYNFGILEDDWGSEMLSFSEFRPSLRALGGPNVLYLNSFTKKLLPSLRIGYLLANAETVQTFFNCKRVSTMGLPAIVEMVLFEFLDRGYYDSHLKRVQKELDQRYQDCLSILRSLMPPEVKWTSPGGGPSLWLEVPKEISLHDLVANLERQKIVIQLSEGSFLGTPHLHGFKIGYAYLNKKEMERALTAVAAEIKKQLK